MIVNGKLKLVLLTVQSHNIMSECRENKLIFGYVRRYCKKQILKILHTNIIQCLLLCISYIDVFDETVSEMIIEFQSRGSKLCHNMKIGSVIIENGQKFRWKMRVNAFRTYIGIIDNKFVEKYTRTQLRALSESIDVVQCNPFAEEDGVWKMMLNVEELIRNASYIKGLESDEVTITMILDLSLEQCRFGIACWIIESTVPHEDNKISWIAIINDLHTNKRYRLMIQGFGYDNNILLYTKNII